MKFQINITILLHFFYITSYSIYQDSLKEAQPFQIKIPVNGTLEVSFKQLEPQPFIIILSNTMGEGNLSLSYSNYSDNQTENPEIQRIALLDSKSIEPLFQKIEIIPDNISCNKVCAYHLEIHAIIDLEGTIILINNKQRKIYLQPMQDLLLIIENKEVFTLAFPNQCKPNYSTFNQQKQQQLGKLPYIVKYKYLDGDVNFLVSDNEKLNLTKMNQIVIPTEYNQFFVKNISPEKSSKLILKWNCYQIQNSTQDDDNDQDSQLAIEEWILMFSIMGIFGLLISAFTQCAKSKFFKNFLNFIKIKQHYQQVSKNTSLQSLELKTNNKTQQNRSSSINKYKTNTKSSSQDIYSQQQLMKDDQCDDELL